MISLREIDRALEKLSRGKAVGIDQLPDNKLRNLLKSDRQLK